MNTLKFGKIDKENLICEQKQSLLEQIMNENQDKCKMQAQTQKQKQHMQMQMQKYCKYQMEHIHTHLYTLPRSCSRSLSLFS